MGRPIQTHHHSEGWIWTTKAHPATRFGSVYPNRLQGLDRATQTGCKIWVEPPELVARFGSNNPNWLQGLDRATRIGCKVWVEQYENSKDFYLSKFVHGFQGSGMSNQIINIIHHNIFDGNYFGVICIVYSCNTICISL